MAQLAARGGRISERRLAGKGLIEQNAQRVNIGLGIQRSRNWRAPSDRLDGGALLGRHIAWRAPQSFDRHALQVPRFTGEVKIEEHRLTVAGQQNIRRLDV